jgi:hypothetical protein
MPTIDFIAHNEKTLRDFKPVLAKSISPDWWKKAKVGMHVRNNFVQTIRSCPAMDDWLKSGWYVLANRDIEVLIYEEQSVTREKKESNERNQPRVVSPSHPGNQALNSFEYLGKNAPVKDAFKMRNPWNIKTPPGYSCFYLDPFLFQNEYFATWQGVIDTDKFNTNQDNSQIIFYPKVNHSFVIKKGTPMCQIIPYKRDNWTATYQLRSTKNWFNNESHHTLLDENRSISDWGRKTKYRGKNGEDMSKMGPYRNEGYWNEKGQFYSEDTPPPECPFHNQEKEDVS